MLFSWSAGSNMAEWMSKKLGPILNNRCGMQTKSVLLFDPMNEEPAEGALAQLVETF